MFLVTLHHCIKVILTDYFPLLWDYLNIKYNANKYKRITISKMFFYLDVLCNTQHKLNSKKGNDVMFVHFYDG